MQAITREEKIISGENLTPITRKEMFLAKASGQDIETPTPITREEMFLSKITGGGGNADGEVTEITTEAEMDALLDTAKEGTVFKYTGETTEAFENGALYMVEESD